MRSSIPIFVLSLAAGTVAYATEYPGWGDTGWVYESKSACCNDAIAIASQYSEGACTTSGGRPSPFEGVQQGTCSWQWNQDGDGNTVYRCYGQSTVWCDD